jgi:putative SOS response-associated peptidase YedK
MCGRYVAAQDPAALAVEFDAVVGSEDHLAPDYNVAPTKQVHLVVDRDLEGERTRALEVARWGLIPSWAKDPGIGSRLINARAETVATKPAFRGAFAKRRCLVPADGYYEWYAPTQAGAPLGRAGKPLKQPFYIHRKDGASLAMAGLYEWWRDDSAVAGDESAWRLTCTIITTEAADGIRRIHDRMPMVIDRSRWGSWLDPDVGPEQASSLLSPSSELKLVAYPVSTRVNSVRNNGPELLTPLEAAEDAIEAGE